MEAFTLVHCQSVFCQFLGHLQNGIKTWQCPKGYGHMAHRVELAEQLICGFASRRRSKTHKRITEVPILLITCYHMNSYVATKSDQKGAFHTRSTNSNQKNCKDTVYTCVQCNQYMCQDCFCLVHM